LENNFEPQYLIPAKAKTVIKDLKEELKKVDTLYLATDLDREGEAISWHLAQALGLGNNKSQITNDPLRLQSEASKQITNSKSKKGKKKKESDIKVHRIVFNQITEKAVKDAVVNPRELDMNLVNAQQARRVLDRLVGYKLSPFLWKKVKRGLSAGRVQSVAVRLIVERERAIEKFKPDEYWTLDAKFCPQKVEVSQKPIEFEAKLNHKVQLFVYSQKEFKELQKKNPELLNSFINGFILEGYLEVF